jgi:hypothetical protein
MVDEYIFLPSQIFTGASIAPTPGISKHYRIEGFNLCGPNPALCAGSQAILRYFIFSLPALGFLTVLLLSDSLGPNLGRFCAEHLWAHAIFCQGGLFW